MKAATSTGRHGHRDATLILLAYRHGLRVRELVSLKWAQVGLKQGQFAVVRAKNGTNSTIPLRGLEIRALRRLKREYGGSSLRIRHGAHGAVDGLMCLEDPGLRRREGGVEFSVHPHMLRRGYGCKLANDGHDTRAIQHYLGHKHIQHTVRYTELALG